MKEVFIVPDMMNLQPLKAVPMGENTYVIEDNMVRCFLFVGTKHALLVDAGFGGEGRSLMELVRTLTDKSVELVITHADPDHIGFAGEFDTVYMHESEIARYTAMEGRNDESVVPLAADCAIDIGGRYFEVLHVPGHTPGSIALLDCEGRILIAGDSVSGMPVFMFGEGRDIHAFMESMKMLSGMKEAFDAIYPSHGPIPLPPEQIDKQIEAAEMYLAGKLMPQEPPFPMPAKMYVHGGAGFYI